MQREVQTANGVEGRWRATRKALFGAAVAAAGATIVVGLFGAGILGGPLIATAAVVAGVWVFADARAKALKEREAQRTREQARAARAPRRAAGPSGHRGP